MHRSSLVPFLLLLPLSSLRAQEGPPTFEAAGTAGVSAEMRAARLRADVGPDGLVVSATEAMPWVSMPDWRLVIRTSGVGRRDALDTTAPDAVAASGSRAELARTGWVEWFEVSARGVRQSWTIAAKPDPDGRAPLRIGLAFDGDLVPYVRDGGGAIVFKNGAQEPVLLYHDLRAWDAAGRELTAHIRPSPWGLGIEVDDERALYPVTVDPLTTSAVWDYDSGQGGAAAAWRGSLAGGATVAVAGDVNGDGFSDVLVGFPMYNSGAGRVVAFYGSSAGLPLTPSWTMDGAAGSHLGSSVASAGNLDSDPYDDVVIGAAGTSSNAGAIHVWLGSSAGLGASGTVVTAPPAFSYTSTFGSASLGASVAPAGDVDGDTFDDFVVGAPGEVGGGGGGGGDTEVTTTSSGRVYVFFGDAPGSLLTSLATPWTDTISGTSGDAGLGWSVAGAGDVNRDGFSDVLVGAPWNGCGSAYAYFGSAAFATDFDHDWTVSSSGGGGCFGGGGGVNDRRFGYSVAGAGDVDGDGHADVLVGWPYAVDPSDNGEVRLYLGQAGGISTSAQILGGGGGGGGTGAGDTLGMSVCTAGDVDGDGFADVIAGGPQLGFNSGTNDSSGLVQLRHGSPTGLGSGQSISFPGNYHGGVYVSGAGDVDGDGLTDVLASTLHGTGGGDFRGGAYLFLGRLSTPGAQITSSITGAAAVPLGAVIAPAGTVDALSGNAYSDFLYGSPLANGGDGRVELRLGSVSGLAGSTVWISPSLGAGARAGSSVSAGDADNDGSNDVLVGAPEYDNGQTDEGRVVLFEGTLNGDLGTVPSWSFESDVAGARLGASAAFVGDVNGDGYADVLVGAPGDPTGGADSGSAALFLGTDTGFGASPNRVFRGLPGSRFGTTVAAAGDVNRDGFSDLMIGSPNYSNGQANEGRVDLYLGNPYGLTLAPNAFPEPNQAGAQWGVAIAAAGDVNGDGASDVLIGSPTWTALLGQAFVYHGIPGGTASLVLVPSTTLTGPTGQPQNPRFGASVAGLGDVNGDGFGDVAVGAPLDDRGAGAGADRGSLQIFYGSSSGIVTAGSETFGGTVNGQALGSAVASAGDLNGDSFADAAVGSTGGNGGIGLIGGGGTTASRFGSNQRRFDDVAAVSLLGRPETTTGFGTNAYFLGSNGNPNSPMGRERARLQWETDLLGTLFDGAGLAATSSWDDTSLHAVGSPFQGLNTGLAIENAYHWRARFRVRNPYLPHTRWLTLPGNTKEEKKLGTGLDCNQNGNPDSNDLGQPGIFDCNDNRWPDSCDIASGFEADWNANQVPDSCDITANPGLDCNGNGILDGSDLAAATSLDCNGNVVPDECDIAGGSSVDTNGDSVPDECQTFATTFCPGDGFGTACPCANSSTPGANEGCMNSLGLGGRLRTSGVASISADTLVLLGTQMPNSSALYFQGTTQANGGLGSVFGDGLRCAAGSIIRLGTKNNTANQSQFPVAGDPSVSVRGAVVAPGTRTYQVWYRNAAAFCSADTFNLSNGVQITWSS